MSLTYKDLRNTTFPDAEQAFIEMIDVNADDGKLLQDYQNAIMNGDFATALDVLQSIQQVEHKILDAEKMNTLFDTCVSLERFYKSNVGPYIEDKQRKWQDIINKTGGNIGYVGEYQSGNVYALNNIALYKENLYISLENNNVYPPSEGVSWNSGSGIQWNQVEPTPGDKHWRALTIKGTDGTPGKGVNFLGDWQVGTAYAASNIVSKNGKLWQALKATTGNDPVSSPAYWKNIGSLQAISIDISDVDNNADYWFQVV